MLPLKRGGRPSMIDYYSVIATAVSRLPSKTDEARCAIYDRARTALQEALRDYEPLLLAKEQEAPRRRHSYTGSDQRHKRRGGCPSSGLTLSSALHSAQAHFSALY